MVWVSSSITRHRAILGVRACQRASLRGRSALPPVPSSPLDYFPFFLTQAMLTKPPRGLQLSCELLGHLQLFPVLEAAASPLRRPAAARREFNCKAPWAGSQGAKSQFTHTPWHPSAQQSQRWGEHGRQSRIIARLPRDT